MIRIKSQEILFDDINYVHQWLITNVFICFPRFKQQTVTVTNANVVSYNGPLLMKYDCHINVVVCSGIKMIKYLHKYLFKGNDRLKIQLAPAAAVVSTTQTNPSTAASTNVPPESFNGTNDPQTTAPMASQQPRRRDEIKIYMKGR
jgi:hypothetical protein